MKTDRAMTLTTLCRVGFALLLIALLSVGHALAAAGPWQGDDDASARLIAGVDGTGQEKGVLLGLDVRLGEGWHAYWRSPGFAGLPPSLDWSASQTPDGNLKEAKLLYPAPLRLGEPGMTFIGYDRSLIYPIRAILNAPGKPLAAQATLNLLVCKQLCVPKNMTLTLSVPAGPATRSAEADALDQATAAVPLRNAADAGVTALSVGGKGQRVTARYGFAAPVSDPLDLFIESPDGTDVGVPSVMFADDKKTVTFEAEASAPVDPKALTFTLVNGKAALEHTGAEALPLPAATQSGAAPAPAPPSAASLSLTMALLLALLGGLILNLMPCVLPVLSLKLLSVVGHGGGDPAVVRRSFLVTASGIVFSFLLLAGFSIALHSAGAATGWGVQFQHPPFLVFLALLLTGFAANLWDLFDVPLPRFLADRLDPHSHPKMAGDFVTGAFATLLATPCTAPFLGTAIGFALALGSALEIGLVFLAMGIGMAVPYIAIALCPRIATAMPKPGRWMTRLRRALGLAVALTALWLVLVLMMQTGILTATLVGLCMAGILVAFGIRRHGTARRVALALVALLAAAALTASIAAPTLTQHEVAHQDRWTAFDESAIAGLVADGKTVFVDVTAAWCLTCKANEHFVLNRDSVTARLFDDPRVVAMKADWTNPDPVIAAYIKRYGRYGIPFNIVYGPGAPDGIVLPELLTEDAVLQALDRAGRTR